MDVVPHQFQLDPARPCGFCLEEFGCDYELVAVISGRMVPMRRDPNHLFFLPDWRNPKRHIQRESVIEFFHLHCFLTRVGDKKEVWKVPNGHWECGLCPEDFWRNPFAFQFQIGRIDFETGMFDPFDHQANLGLLCADCVTFNFGEGDHEEGKAILGVA
jgi:hypothetical protein